MIKLMDIINEGGWASTKTQGTKITPALVAKTMPYLNNFVKKFNAIVDMDGKPPIEIVSPVGSTKYWKQDLKNDPEKEYGDIDMLVSFPVWATHGKNSRDNENISIKYYRDKIMELGGQGKYYLDADTAKTGGKNLIFKIDKDYIQIDFVVTTPELKNWTKGRFTPEHGLKGFTVGYLFSALGQILGMSTGDRGVIAKLKGGEIVPFNKRKDVQVIKISSNFKNFIMDILKFLAEYVGKDYKTIKLHSDLKKHKGLDPSNVQLKNLAKGIAGLAKTLELNGMLDGKKIKAKSATDLMKKIYADYSKRMIDQLSGSKFKKANSPEAYQAIDKIKKNTKIGLDIVRKNLK